MTCSMPIIIFVFALNVPTALYLYCVITNLFSAGQTLLINNPFKIRKEREEKERKEKARQRKLAKAKRKAYKSNVNSIIKVSIASTMDTFFVNKNIISQIYLCGYVYFLIIILLK